MTTETNAPSEGAAPTAPARDTVADASALYIGVSRPKDAYGTHATDRDHLSDEELAAMGVEPDEPPKGTLIATFVAITLIVAFSAIVLVGFVSQYGQRRIDENSGFENAIHAEKRIAAEAVLGAYGGVDEGAGTYRIPVERAMTLVAANPALLTRHPLGPEVARIAPAPTLDAEGSGEEAAVEPAAGDVPADDPTAATADALPTDGQE